jgi:hypothetical protein
LATQWNIRPTPDDKINMERLLKLRPHLRNSKSAALSWLLFKELANDKTARFDLPTEYQEDEDDE